MEHTKGMLSVKELKNSISDGDNEESIVREGEQEQTKKSDGEFYCESCGAALETWHKFCAVCGTPVEGKQNVSEAVIEIVEDGSNSNETKDDEMTSEQDFQEANATLHQEAKKELPQESVSEHSQVKKNELSQESVSEPSQKSKNELSQEPMSELSIVEKALKLHKEVRSSEESYGVIRRKSYPSIQAPEKVKISAPRYPKIDTGMRFGCGMWMTWMIGAFLILLFGCTSIDAALFFIFLLLPCWAIGFPLAYSKVKKNKTETIRNSDGYRATCQAIYAEYQKRLAEAEKDYQAELAHYQNVVLPEYNEKKKQWDAEHRLQLQKAEERCDKAKKELATHYSSTGIIPQKYHDIESLEYIYSILRSSQYTLKEAIDNYDRHMQRQIEQRRLEAQRKANEIAYQQAMLIDEQNNLMDERNQIEKKAIVHQDMWNAVAAKQRHNTNKKLDELIDRKK